MPSWAIGKLACPMKPLKFGGIPIGMAELPAARETSESEWFFTSKLRFTFSPFLMLMLDTLDGFISREYEYGRKKLLTS